MPFQCDLRFEKGEKKFIKRRVRTQFDRVKKHACALPTTSLKLVFHECHFAVLTLWWTELVLIAFANKVGYLHLV